MVSRRRVTRRAGYTLIELMIVVMIIGISTVAFSPGIGRAVADRRASTAARELIRVGRRARADTMGSLRAHLLFIDAVNKRVQLLRGNTNSCTLSTAAWAVIAADCPATVTGTHGSRCIEDVGIDNITSNGNVQLYLETLSGSTASYSQPGRVLCFGANGVMFWGAGLTIAAAVTAGLTDANTAAVNGGFVYALHAGTGAPTTTSRVHRVLFPLGGSARSLR
jgi:prepilin-type N-terminal cleavage/methylation domain-containing protein